ncbi:hypothetical protein AGABI2DRAFT_114728 [Agaricus bisporus var. bisporus H97]|uniref:hypothetical protein n=1 Tax=Agaricus bisporus var. bisporus (strain H97 / ATCC MYA-4626 / FGSC 10389) TaxID=936046 RepID=UPI00029F7A97|nr:hypothetical protein AGABI2DRAFT_114728 [Agaricus bisporus var. bisporus H97]EKV51993.1 hypothetical protein AGABI2DRAFT_114728 [Agaricus bisporus var. bisporus H97]
MPANHMCLYERGEHRVVKLNELYEKSIAERPVLPSTPPAMTITLEKRLNSSTRRIPHVWTAHVQGNTSQNGATMKTAETVYPPMLVAKIFDPVFLDEDEAYYSDAFLARDRSVYSEVKAYEKLKHLQGTLLAQFYGLFTATLPAQHNRTVHVILLEEVPGMDLRLLLPPKVAERVCSRHREAIFDRVLNLYLDLCDCGVNQHDMHPRNVILRPQEHVVPGTRFCNTDDCPLTLQIDCDDFHLVMIDFECVEFEEEDFFAEMRAYRQRDLDELKVQCREEGWLEGEMQWN